MSLGHHGANLCLLLRVTIVTFLRLFFASGGEARGQLERCQKIVQETGLHEAVIGGDMNTECLPGSRIGSFIAGTPEPSAEELARECAVSLRIGSTEGEDEQREEGEPVDTVPAAAGPTEATCPLVLRPLCLSSCLLDHHHSPLPTSSPATSTLQPL